MRTQSDSLTELNEKLRQLDGAARELASMADQSSDMSSALRGDAEAMIAATASFRTGANEAADEWDQAFLVRDASLDELTMDDPIPAPLDIIDDFVPQQPSVRQRGKDDGSAFAAAASNGGWVEDPNSVDWSDWADVPDLPAAAGSRRAAH